jgi:hypothetical protein
MWSAWKWVSTSSGTRCTPSRSKQASTADASGPASTTMAEPGLSGTASASPCPTSHATTTQSVGGQPVGPSTCAPPSTSTKPPTSDPAARRRLTSMGASVLATITAARTSRPPVNPDRHGTTAHGRPALVRATQTIQSAGQPASVPATAATGCDACPSSVADSPRIVVAGTAGAAIRLAARETRLICPDSMTTMGSVASWAAADSATASASAARDSIGPGSRAAIRSRQPGASTSIPPVASTDSAKPYERASHGSIRSSTRTVPARAASPARRRPVTSAASRIIAITAARRTLGWGLASTTNPATATNPTAPAARRDRPSARATPMTTPATIARLAPDTAVRWLSPQRRKSSTRSSGICVVSPTASAGIRPRAAGSRPATACRRSARIPEATDWTADSAESTVGLPRGLNTAAVPSRRLGGASLPVVRTRWLGTSPAQRSVAGARISTGNRSRV